MNATVSSHIVDLSVFVIANLTNLLLAAMFLFRARGSSNALAGKCRNRSKK